jgi:hypothetical protein
MTTVATDLLLGILGIGFAWDLFRSGSPGEWGRRLWASALAAHGLAALMGAGYHGFERRMTSASALALWHGVLAMLCIGSALLVGGLAWVVLGRRGRILVVVTMGIKMLAYAFWISARADFLPALWDQGITLLALLFLLGRETESLRLWILAGVVLTLGGDLVEALAFSPGPSFDRNGLYHLIESGALACFYIGGRRMNR